MFYPMCVFSGTLVHLLRDASSGEMKAASSSTSSGTYQHLAATGIFSGFTVGFPGSGW